MQKFKEFFSKNKRICIIIAAVLVFAIVAAVIVININGKKASTEPETTSTTEEPTTKVVEVPTTEKATEAPIDTGFYNPFTGEPTEVDYSGTRPYVIMLNTIRQALPQSGNSYADMYIEMTEEGGITRILGLYNNLDDVPKIGTVRSTREYFLSWAMGLDAIMVHAGGDSWVFDEINATHYTSLNCVGGAGYDSWRAFFRDEERIKKAGREHSLYTTGENLLKLIEDYNIDLAHTREDYTKFNFAKDGEGTPKDGIDAEDVNVTFSGYKNTRFLYNEDTGKYDVYFWDEKYIDELDGQGISVKNVIILPVPNWSANDAWGHIRQKYNMAGGTGYYISGGKCIEIDWTKGDYNDASQYANAFNMTTKDGKPLELSVGKTYICMMSNVYPPTIKGKENE